MKIIQATPTLTNKNIKERNYFSSPNFGLTVEPKSKIFDSLKESSNQLSDFITKLIIKPIVKVINSNGFENLVEKTKNCKNLVQHLTALTSFVLSGFYIQRTLKNDKLDEQRRKTLAINEGAVTVLSTILSYTVCKTLDKSIQKFSNKFLMLNSKNNLDIKTLETYQNGIKNAASIMIFMSIYRFISPVIVTPLANHIGNKINEKKQIAPNGVKND